MLSDIRPAIVSTVLFTLLLGLGYPLVITGIAHVAFPYQAEGSLVTDSSGHVIGSELLAQPFAKDEYLHPRPSAAGNGYDPTSSGGSNYGPLSPDLAKRIAGDADALRKSTGHQTIPDDAITTSASGLDPDISPAYADLQVDRIAKARGASAQAVRALIDAHVQPPLLGFIGQPRVNVLMTNLALDKALPKAQPGGR
ncbi:MAG TPA: potassium-transporting ATPase subunit KdpC [Caulobacteraceae bacterium]|nr:potassium-transporting ATPase subunit KdpC [Caulobacteraceae bacterium]